VESLLQENYDNIISGITATKNVGAVTTSIINHRLDITNGIASCRTQIALREKSWNYQQQRQGNRKRTGPLAIE
jgi:hypothetical protein